MLIFLSILLVCIITLLGTMLFLSPGKLQSVLDDTGNTPANALSEKIHVNINGADMGMIIQKIGRAHV